MFISDTDNFDKWIIFYLCLWLNFQFDYIYNEGAKIKHNLLNK